MKIRLSSSLVLVCAAMGALIAPRQLQAQPRQPPAEPEVPLLSTAQLSQLLGGPTKATLRFENADMGEVIRAASQKFNVPLALTARTAAKGPVTLDLQEQTLWAVWSELRSQVQYNRTGASVTPRNSLLITPPTEVKPALTFDAGMLQVRTTGARVRGENWTLAISAITDPKLDIASPYMRLKITEAVDDNDNDLMATNDRPRYFTRQSPSLWVGSFQQPSPANLGTRIVRLRGMVTGYAIVNRERWEVPLNTLPQERRFDHDGNRDALLVSSMAPGDKPGRYEVELSRVQRPGINIRFWDAATLQSEQAFNQALFGDVSLVDDKGRTFYLHKSNMDSESDDSVVTRIWKSTFGRTVREGETETAEAPTGEPAKLIWNVPREVRAFGLPFEFNDVEMTRTN